MTHPLFQFFSYIHLKPPLSDVSKMFHDAAVNMIVIESGYVHADKAVVVADLVKQVDQLPDNIERTECLRKLRILHTAIRGFGIPAGGISLDFALRQLLEAKDCAVRTVLYKDPSGA